MWQWGRWYRQIYEMPAGDRPDDATIHDDKRCDAWFDQYVRNAARKSGRGQGDSRYQFFGNDTPKAIPVFTPAQEAENAARRSQ